MLHRTDLQVLLGERHPAAFTHCVKALVERGVIRRFLRGSYVHGEFDLPTPSRSLAPESYVSFDNALARHLVIGSRPTTRVPAAKPGRAHGYRNFGFEVVQPQVAPHIDFGHDTEHDVRWADTERGAFDTLYFHLRGRRFHFDIHDDLDTAHLDRNDHPSRIEELPREIDGVSIHVEANVDVECPSEPISTAAFAQRGGQPAHLVRVMRLDRSLAHTLATWNERRLLRDLYDVYYLAAWLGAKVDLGTLDTRLAKIESRSKGTRGRRTMSRAGFLAELRDAVSGIEDARVRNELAPVLPAEELAGLVPRIRAGVMKAIEDIESRSPNP